jgi:DNA-binding response OmpR family regulator
VRAVLRRPQQIASTTLKLGNVTVDVDAMTSKVCDRPIDLSRQEFTVLMTLLGAGGKLIPKRKLEDAIYSFDKEVSPNAIEAAVSRLRKRLEAEGASVDIVAMRGLGYLVRERERVDG